MAIQIALCFSPECEEELIEMGFKKIEHYVKRVEKAGNTKEQVEEGDSEFFHMTNKPFQFVTTSWWGAGPD